MGSSKFGKGFKAMREKCGYTQKSFCEKFNANEHITTLDSVKNWEQGKCVPEIETILKLCDFFNCDIDCLFDRISCKTHDAQFIFDETGLKEDAINVLKGFSDKEQIMLFINNLLSDTEHLYFIAKAYYDFKGKRALEKAIETSIIEEDCSADAMCIKNDLDYLRFTLSNRFNAFCEKTTSMEVKNGKHKKN